ncbi:sodium:alanine symporter family protein [Persicobacter sp. CCB-QB2]|uniref:alanine/glycine:cation symporter family protein n=1 Tax=Persicobacter sp. CCB-QB2 TaxID=1561025 RepID=UPI000B13A8A0|nr:amino acid carrier protein [Persicobacter sp. CCB-QB2]
MIQSLNNFLATIDSYIGGSMWFVFALLGTGLFFTIYLGFPQIKYFGHALKILSGKYDKDTDEGDTSHFQALSTALSGTVGTGNIAGVALAVHLGGPAAIFWMVVTAFFGMTTKFVEVTLSHKYREKTADGTMAGGPMYFMKNRLKMPKLAAAFAIFTVISSFGTGSLPQINSISNAMFSTFSIPHWITGAVLAVLLAGVIIGGIKRIAAVTSRLVPAMAFIYLVGALLVIIYNYENILPSLSAVFQDVFTGSAASGGFLGAAISFAFTKGVGRGLFSNEAGQGSAPIAHASAKAHEPVSEGMVAILEPFIDTIVICSLTGLVLLSSGVWKEKHENVFQNSDMVVLRDHFNENNQADKTAVAKYFSGGKSLPTFSGEMQVVDGQIQNNVTVFHNRSWAEDIQIFTKTEKGTMPYNGSLRFTKGKWDSQASIIFKGKSLLHSSPLTAIAFTKSFLGEKGKYIVTIGLLLFAFSTAISWSYYGDRAMTFLFGSRSVIWFRVVYVVSFFIASFTDTTIIWTFSGIAIALMTLPNLFGILTLHKEMKTTIQEYWNDFDNEFPGQHPSDKPEELIK